VLVWLVTGLFSAWLSQKASESLDLAFAVSDSHGERRLLHRITIAGQKRS
jgi:hypothetical protein